MVKKIELTFGNVVIKNSQNEKLLEVFFDEKATFGYLIENMCVKAIRKRQVLACVAPYMDLSKRKFLIDTFFISQFSYFLLAWICHSRALNNKINTLDKLCLRLIYTTSNSLLMDVLKRMTLSHYILEICKLLPLRCTKS